MNYRHLSHDQCVTDVSDDQYVVVAANEGAEFFNVQLPGEATSLFELGFKVHTHAGTRAGSH